MSEDGEDKSTVLWNSLCDAAIGSAMSFNNIEAIAYQTMSGISAAIASSILAAATGGL
jgi:hypothetical protein